MNPASKSARLRAATDDTEYATSTKIVFFLPVLLVALWVGSIFYHSERVVPRDVVTLRDYYERYGNPTNASTFRLSGVVYYRLTGEIAAPLAFPDGPPQYIFDYLGRLDDWSPEYRTDPEFQQKWSASGERTVTIPELLDRFPKG
jgi:hypothetical protein